MAKAMVVRVRGSSIQANVDQRCEVLMERGNYVIVESCGNGDVFRILPKDILAIEITPSVCLRTTEFEAPTKAKL